MIAWAAALLDDFLVRAAIGGIGVALLAGPMGCFVVWQRLAYFGVALSHAALLGVALGLLLGLLPMVSVALLSMLLALAFIALERRRLVAGDTLLGVLAHVALALGVITLAFMEQVRVDLMAYLFGDVLAITHADLALIYALGAPLLVLLAWIWRPLLSLTVQEDLALVEGVAVLRTRLVYMLMLALVIAVGMRIVGILLVISLLVIPAAAARRLASTPEAMALLAAAVGVLSVLGGLWASFWLDVPSGPAIVVASSVVFLVVVMLPGRRRAAA